MTRRAALVSVLAASFYRPAQASAGSSKVIIASAGAGAAHTAAIEALQQVLSAAQIAASTFRLPADDAAFQQELKNGSSQLAIAVGVDAIRPLFETKTKTRPLTTMCFRADFNRLGIAESASRLAGAVWLDISIQQILSGLRVVFPDADRVTVIRNASQAEAMATAHPQAAVKNVRFVDCSNPTDLITELRRLRGQTDFVVCLPDSTLYNKTTVEPLILSSLELRLPLVGFSSSFVKAGAAVGVYPDFADIGRQTALMAQRCLLGGAVAREECPSRVTIAANQRVLHLLGRDYKRKSEEVVLFQ